MDDIADAILAVARDALNTGATEAVRRAQASHPYTDRSHNLTDTLSVTSDDREIAVRADATYASHVEKWARREGGGAWFFARVREGLESVEVTGFEPGFDTTSVDG